jgi:bifunctional DNA-binding transcriptional regulator/antitoxin component of YhaV-PrlF toxin-antitoxin module
MILQVTDSGQLILPAELVQAPPRTPLEAKRQGDAVVVKPVPAASSRRRPLTFPNLAGPAVDESEARRSST